MRTFINVLNMWIPVVFWCALIFCLSSVPHLKTDMGVWDVVLRKIAHVFEYAVLALLVSRALRGSVDFDLNKIFCWTIIFCILYAVSDEVHQAFVPGRGPSILDVLIDSVGIMLALFFWKRKMNSGWIQNTSG